MLCPRHGPLQRHHQVQHPGVYIFVLFFSYYFSSPFPFVHVCIFRFSVCIAKQMFYVGVRVGTCASSRVRGVCVSVQCTFPIFFVLIINWIFTIHFPRFDLIIYPLLLGACVHLFVV